MKLMTELTTPQITDRRGKPWTKGSSQRSWGGSVRGVPGESRSWIRRHSAWVEESVNTPATNLTVTTCLTQPSKVSRKWECYVHRSVQLDLVILLLVPNKGRFLCMVWFLLAFRIIIIIIIRIIRYFIYTNA